MLFITSYPPGGQAQLHWDGEYVPIFPNGFLGFRIRRCASSILKFQFKIDLLSNDQF